MFFRKKKEPQLNAELLAQVEYAQRRMRQKKGLYNHIVIFLIGAVFLIGINKVLKYGAAYDWYLWALAGWGFLLAIHAAKVFITQRFLGPEWERAQREKLVHLQQERIRKLEAEVAAELPLPEAGKKKEAES